MRHFFGAPLLTVHMLPTFKCITTTESLISLSIAEMMCFCHVRGSDPGLQLDATYFCGLRKIFLQLFLEGWIYYPPKFGLELRKMYYVTP